MIETILEHRAWIAPVLAGTLTTAAGSKAVTGTGLDGYAVNDIIWWTDDAGKFQQNQIAVVTDANNATLYENSESVSTGVTPRILNAAAQTMYWFRCNNALIRTPIIRPGNDYREQAIMAGGAAGSYVTQIDMDEGILLKSVYVRLPYQYTMADSTYRLSFYYVDAAGSFVGRIQSIGEDSNIFIPRENTEVEVNAYIKTPIIDYPTITGSTWQLAIALEDCVEDLADTLGEAMQLADVSQVNGPAALNNQQVPVVVGARVVHAATFLT